MKEALPKAPSFTLPTMLSPSNVALNSSVMGMGVVMSAFQESESPSTLPFLISISPPGPLILPVSALPLVCRVSVAFWAPMGAFMVVF